MRYLLLSACILFMHGLGFSQDVTPINIEGIFGNMQARQIGPALMSGRVIDLEVHPRDGNIFYVGSAGGGVWKTIDGGITFSPIFDEHIQSIGSIEINPENPDQEIWVGTGEIWTRNSVSVGDGLYKSSDGGKKWKKMGFEDSERISSIVINPENTTEMYVGILGPLWGDYDKRGVFKSTDGGQTWTHILKGGPALGCSDLFMDPQNPDILYASLWEFRRKAWSFNSGGDKSALYKSMDGGQNWKKIHNGLPEGKMGRIALAVAPSSPNILYSVIESEIQEKKGLYRSEDSGENWVQLNNDFELTVRPFYFSRIVVSPHDPDIIAKAGLNGSISRDGGNTFRSIQSSVHSDIHDFEFHPTDKNRIYLGSDGGVYRSLDGGNIWTISQGLPLSQYYHVTVDNEKPFNVYGGLQDNGSWIGVSSADGGISSKHWTSVGAGDGFRVYPHPEDPNIVYSEMQEADNIWRVDVKRNQTKIVKPYPEEGDPKLRFNWNPALATGLHNPDALFVGSQFLHRSDDRGETWRKISPDLTTNDKSKQNQSESGGLSTDNSGAENHCTIFTIGESPIDENMIWVGTDDGNVQLTLDGGKTWTNMRKNIKGVPENTWVYHIEPSVFDKNVAYVVFDGHTRNDMKPYVFKTADGGATWKNIATDDIKLFARSIQEDFENPNLLYLGTECGLYITLDGGQNWAHFTNNVPPVAIHHVTMQARDRSLVMGTHGRGIIIIDDVEPLRQFTKEVAESKVHFFEMEPTEMREGYAFNSGFGVVGEYIGRNPTSNAQIVYYLDKRHTFGKMKMEILDQNGQVIADLSPGKSKGINIVQWNYRHKRPKVAKGKTFTFGAFSTPMVPPGEYKVRMTKGKEVYEHTIEMKVDPNSIHSMEDRLAGYEATMRLYRMNEQLAYIVDQLDAIKMGTDEALKAEVSKKLGEMIKEFNVQVENTKEPLVVMTGDNYVGAAEPLLREKIASLYSNVTGYVGRPSNAQLKSLEDLNKQLNSAFQNFENVLEELKTVNKRLEKEKLEPIKVKSIEEFLKV